MLFAIVRWAWTAVRQGQPSCPGLRAVKCYHRFTAAAAGEDPGWLGVGAWRRTEVSPSRWSVTVHGLRLWEVLLEGAPEVQGLPSAFPLQPQPHFGALCYSSPHPMAPGQVWNLCCGGRAVGQLSLSVNCVQEAGGSWGGARSSGGRSREEHLPGQVAEGLGAVRAALPCLSQRCLMRQASCSSGLWIFTRKTRSTRHHGNHPGSGVLPHICPAPGISQCAVSAVDSSILLMSRS